jgi:hypothetical protein
MKSLLVVLSQALWAAQALDLATSRARFAQSFSSPAGKLTFCPELEIAEPAEPTALLLLTSAVQDLSGKIRACKANAAFMRGSITALNAFCNEQATAAGGFPGPVPVVFCIDADLSLADIPTIAECGAHGVLVGATIQEPADLAANKEWQEVCRAALDYGVQPIPEICVAASSVDDWKDDKLTALVDTIHELLGEDPVTIVLTVQPDAPVDDDEAVEAFMTLPRIPKALSKRVPMMGSVFEQAGDNRLSGATAYFKESGFTSNLLRSSCLPGFSTRIDLSTVGKFWAGCITDLKSTKSKSFSFRSKNNMETSLSTQWGNYQQSIMDSGALGDPSESVSIDEAAGDYQGFA